MITVRLYGLLRLEHGIAQAELEADTVSQVFTALEARGIPRKELKATVVLVNGKPARRRDKLNSGDVVQLMSPVAGG